MQKSRLIRLVIFLGIFLFLRSRKRSPIKAKETRVFLVTGAASGIGRHLTSCLLARGQKVVATDLNYEALSSFYLHNWKAHGDRIMIKKLDVQSAEEWQEVVHAAVTIFGSLNVLLNVAGYIHPGEGFKLDVKQIDLHMNINAKGMMIGCQVASEQMIKQKEGHIINFSSLAGIYCLPGIAIYSASKHAIRAYSRALAFELDEHNVHVTVVCPAAVQTPMLEKQIPFKQAALTFSDSKNLTVEDIEKEIFDHVLPYRPHEVSLPGWRGAMAPFMNLLPDQALIWLIGIMKGQGSAAQRKIALEKGGAL